MEYYPAVELFGRSSKMSVSSRFNRLLSNLSLTALQRTNGINAHGKVRTCLNQHYWGTSSATEHSLLIGSWGKSTAIRPPRDIDVIFVLPYDVWSRFQEAYGNKQSQLLQEVKNVLRNSFPTTSLRADGQVVVVPFANYTVEIVPAFKAEKNQYLICDTNDGGRYNFADPLAEMANVQSSSDVTKGNTRDLIRMMKRWQSFCNVPIKSFAIELVALCRSAELTHSC